MREHPWPESKIIQLLNKDDSVTINSAGKKLSVVNEYIGRWCNITHQNKTGYVLSCFLSGKLLKEKTFNEFYDNLSKQISNKNIDYEQIRFPLLYVTESLEGSSRSIQINNKNDIKLNYLLPIINNNFDRMIKTDGEKIFVYLLSKDSDYSVSYIFMLVNNKWKLTQINLGSD